MNGEVVSDMADISNVETELALQIDITVILSLESDVRVSSLFIPLFK